VKQLTAAVFLLLAACHEKRPPAPSAEQSAQLNDAEDMLNNMGNEEGPADQGTHQSSTLMGPSSAGPSNESD
jgi:hypothetical protein